MIGARFRALTAHSKQLKTAELLAAATAVQIKHLNKAKTKLQQYPPEIPSSEYIRTGELGRNWQVQTPRLTADGLLGRVINTTEYAHFVHGDNSGEGQAVVHQGRWPLMRDIIDRDAYISDLRSIIKR